MRFPIAFFLVLLSLGTSTWAQTPTVGLIENTPQSYNGYTLFAPISSNSVYLIDNCGREVNTWFTGSRPGLSTYLLEDGRLLHTGRENSPYFNFGSGGGNGGLIEIYTWDGQLEWSYLFSNERYYQHHDVAYMPNGNILVLAWEHFTALQADSLGVDTTALPGELWATMVAEIVPIGSDSMNIVWEWHLADHLIQDVDSSRLNYGTVSDHPELVDPNYALRPLNPNPDLMHANSIYYNEVLDQIIISLRNTSEFWIIDHSTTTAEASMNTGGGVGRGGDLLYRWGNPEAYGRGTDVDQQLFVQHDAHWIEAGLSDAGKIMIYNNGTDRPEGDYSSVVVIDPPVQPDGSYTWPQTGAFAPADPYWEYMSVDTFDFYSQNISGAQRLPNGNTLICEGAAGHLFEVDSLGNEVWDYINPIQLIGPATQGGTAITNTVFRAYRYGTDYAGLAGLDLTPGQPLELLPYTSNCEIYSSVKESPNKQVQTLIYPNPFSGQLHIDLPKDDEVYDIRVLDLTGRIVYAGKLQAGVNTLSTYNWPAGHYFITVNMDEAYRVALVK